jgi:hypothetical protein
MADKELRPPYASGADLDRLFARMRVLSDPKKIDSKWVKGYKLAGAQPQALVSVLRWLGVIDSNGKSLGVWNELRSGGSETLARLVKDSYSDIFSSVDVKTATREDLEGAFIRAYESGDTGRHIKCFLALCAQAEIATAGPQRDSPKAKPAATRAGNQAKAVEQVASKRSKGVGAEKQRVVGDSPITVSLNVEIPAGWDEETVRRRIALVREAIQAS